jgi:hypothetical protein
MLLGAALKPPPLIYRASIPFGKRALRLALDKYFGTVDRWRQRRCGTDIDLLIELDDDHDLAILDDLKDGRLTLP